jgi:hypothetical protein
MLSPAQHDAAVSRAVSARDSLRAALAQSLDTDDQIILDRVRQAEMLIDAVYQMLAATRQEVRA